MNAPEVAQQHVELLTRDADCPEEASGTCIAPPPPSRLVSQTMGASDAVKSSSKDTVKVATAAMNGLKLGAAKAAAGATAKAAAA